MYEQFLWLDRRFFYAFNHLPHSFLTDSFFLFFSVAGVYGAIWILLAFMLIKFDGMDNRKELISIFIALMLEIFAVEILLKNTFLRIRPETALSDAVSIMSPMNSYSFPSGHATIAFASAYILSMQRKKSAWIFYLLAILVAVSRVYLGRHYPSDVLYGAAIGYFIGVSAYILGGKVFKSLPGINRARKK